jgi:hypothetical protein
MRVTMSKEWFERAVANEEGLEVSAGLGSPAVVLAAKDETLTEEEPCRSYADLAVFGKLVNLRRRERRLTLEALAQEADLGLDEVCAIDSGRWEHPKPRTVRNLASVLSLPHSKLMQLSGLMQARNQSLQDAAVHFAARAENLEALSPQEAQALQEFVKYLSEV